MQPPTEPVLHLLTCASLSRIALVAAWTRGLGSIVRSWLQKIGRITARESQRRSGQRHCKCCAVASLMNALARGEDKGALYLLLLKHHVQDVELQLVPELSVVGFPFCAEASCQLLCSRWSLCAWHTLHPSNTLPFDVVNKFLLRTSH
jgi:hypothetical protein